MLALRSRLRRLLLTLTVPTLALAGPTTQQVTPEYSPAILDNPGMGVYLFSTTDEKALTPSDWYYDLVQIGYARVDWSSLQAEGAGEGDYRFEEQFGPLFDLWVKKLNKRLSFRVMSSNMHSRRKYVTPTWVFDAGVPSVTHKGLYVPEQIDPVFWDDKYLAIQDRFIAQLGEYLDGREGVEFIDIGGIGEWGEMHLSRWTSQQLADAGFTKDRYIAAYRHMIDAYVKAFPRTRIFLNVGDYAAINDYAASRGVHFRQDGLNPEGASYQVGPRFYREYARRGVLCNYEMFAGYKEMQDRKWDLLKTFEVGLQDPVSYWHINLLSYNEMRDPPADFRKAMEMLGERLGYHLAITKLQCNQAVSVGSGVPGRLHIRHTWTNHGVAAPVQSYAIEWLLRDPQGRTILSTIHYPRTPTTRWWSNETIEEDTILRVPADMPEGSYTLSARMLLPEQPSRPIQLAMKARADDGSYRLATIAARRPEEPLPGRISLDFAQPVTGWSFAKGMSASHSQDGHAQAGSLQITGRQPGESWSYGGFTFPQSLRPAAQYRLSCWLKVSDWSSKSMPPYVKIAFNDAAGKWMTNISSEKYDLENQGQWQELTIMFDVPANAAQTSFAIERGDFLKPSAGTILLDDLELQLLETP